MKLEINNLLYYLKLEKGYIIYWRLGVKGEKELKIYIVLSMTGTKFSRFLKLMTRREFTHVSISLDKELNMLYSFGRRSMIMPLIAGFIREDVYNGVFKKYDSSCEVLELEVTDQQYYMITKAIQGYIKSYGKYRYNFLGLPFMWFDIPLERSNHLVCSQFVAKILLYGNVCHFNKSWTLIRPMDFYNIEGINSIFKGHIREYKQLVDKNENIVQDQSA